MPLDLSMETSPCLQQGNTLFLPCNGLQIPQASGTVRQVGRRVAGVHPCIPPAVHRSLLRKDWSWISHSPLELRSHLVKGKNNHFISPSSKLQPVHDARYLRTVLEDGRDE